MQFFELSFGLNRLSVNLDLGEQSSGVVAMRAIDLFAGIGGMRIAAERVGFQTVFSSEIEPAARNLYELNFGEAPSGDITAQNASEIPDHELLLAGFPCQPFSKSGVGKGFADTRGTLFFEIARILEAKRPAAAILENVKGLIGHDSGRTLRKVLTTLAELGYQTSLSVLNAKDFGLPQNRERVVIAAVRGEFEAPDLTPNLPRFKPRLRHFLGSCELEDYLDPGDFTMLPTEMQVEQASGLIFAGYLNKPIRKNGARPNTSHLSRVHRQHNRIYSVDGVSPTLSSQESSGRNYLLDDYGVRRLKVDEAFRIMGFPESFKKNASPTALRRAIGNSVAVPVIEAVVRRVQDSISGAARSSDDMERNSLW